MNGRTPGAPASQALARAARWRVLSMLLERPRAGWSDDLRRQAEELGDAQLSGLARRAAQASEGRYLALLGPGGAVSPREAGYRGMVDPGRTLTSLAATYAAFAYRPELSEPADHVAIETGFLAYLHLKEAYALSRGDARDTEVTREGFLDGLAVRLRAADPEELGRAARLAAEFAGLRAEGLPVVDGGAVADDAQEFGCGRG
jgi:hypothetical protein